MMADLLDVHVGWKAEVVEMIAQVRQAHPMLQAEVRESQELVAVGLLHSNHGHGCRSS
jgi:hypothetical protein